jgi:hypothetical protein
MLEDAADVVETQLGEARVAVAGHQWLAILPDRLVGVHARAVVLEKGLGHEGRRHPVLARHLLHHVLVLEELVGHLDERLELHVDLGLTAGRHLVVLRLDGDAELLHHETHLGADVL